MKEQGLAAATPRSSTTLAPKIEPPKITRKLVSYKLVPAGENVVLRVAYTGAPAPHVEWLKNGDVSTN